MIVQIGDAHTKLSAAAVTRDGTIEQLSFTATDDSPWLLLFFYPADFTWVCPTELRALHDNDERFAELDTVVWAISTDSLYVHEAWRDDVLGDDFCIPLVSDRNWSLCERFQCLDYGTGTAQRCTVILDPSGKVRYYSTQDGSVGRSIYEVVRMLSALQAVASGDVTCEGWEQGDETITPGS